MNPASTTTIQLSNLTKKFGHEVAVDGLALVVKEGTTLGLLGPNGAGKSTTIRMLMGMLRPTSGRIRIFGRDLPPDASQVRRRIGFVPDTCPVYRWMTVKQVIQFCRPMYPSWNDSLCEDLIDQFRLPLQSRVERLSLGMKAKLSLLIALTPQPELLVLDEPLSGLDPIARDEFVEGVLKGICSSNQTVLMSSHQLDEVARLADEVAIMNRGRILLHKPLEDLNQNVKQVRAVLQDGCRPNCIPLGTIHHTVKGREWRITLMDVSSDVLEQIRAANPVDSLDLFDVRLDELFREVIQGDELRSSTHREAAPC